MKPSLPEIILNFTRAGLDRQTALREGEKFFLYHEQRGWTMGRNGKVKMKSWTAAAATWRRNMKQFSIAESKDISAPRPLQSCKTIKTETDETAYRVVINDRLHEFDRNTPPPAGTAIWLAWNNWKASPESYKRA